MTIVCLLGSPVHDNVYRKKEHLGVQYPVSRQSRSYTINQLIYIPRSSLELTSL